MSEDNIDLINKMTDEINSEEMGAMSYVERIQPPKLEDFGKTNEERLNRATMQMELRWDEIRDAVTLLANKFDISNNKTYSQIKQIVMLQLFQKEIYKRVMLQVKVESNTKSTNSTKDWFAEHRKYTEIISKLIGQVHIEEIRKDVAFNISREQLYGTAKYILIEESK